MTHPRIFCLKNLLRASVLFLLIASLYTATPAADKAKRAESQSADKPKQHDVMAIVNSQRILRDQLAQECLRHYGKDSLESYVNRLLIETECQKAGIEITQAEVDKKILTMANQFRVPLKQWFKMIEEEKGIKPDQYAEEIIWPTIALQKLAGKTMEVDEDEIRRAYESEYGEKILARIISSNSREKAEKLRAMVTAEPDKFGEIAKKYSDDTQSASRKGQIPPIKKHVGFIEFEKAAFSMEDGQISDIIQIGEKYLILCREGSIPTRQIPLEQVADQFEFAIKEKKLFDAGPKIFKKLQEGAELKNYLNDPNHRDSGVVAVLNGREITLQELSDLCMKRHGEVVLEGTISRMLIEQACKLKKIKVTEKDLGDEVRLAASLALPMKKDDTPDVEGWLDMATKQQGISREIYLYDQVWPTVALKKLVEGQVKITGEDIDRGFEANYGVKVKCLAIVMDNLRRAQKVWSEAREDPTPENFGLLAQEHSIEQTSKNLKGQVPPIRRFGGRETLEKEAFSLKKGELSGIIQDGENFIILLCLGHTTPVEVEKSQVRQLIYDDLFEKKQRIMMQKHYLQLQNSAEIDNFLTGTIQSPSKSSPKSRRNKEKVQVPNLRQTAPQRR
jgi:parvulin-like peptidyl-prolyl isomerase